MLGALIKEMHGINAYVRNINENMFSACCIPNRHEIDETPTLH